ncbi:4'-phosphopantetheinyl transferase superfamily protein [uncultured Desulfosarcina sp.]|uniref:4'-phosphopantetheinyl transferase family protein n=1 Tax=uncultured Desulfosarcina sp. TaxID=218289 RepID=UPI0029C95E48|nr:4'-phosphopantetheinyl transferase superfamily protein [uncultured Desulfosarcina sp.]
MMPAATTIFPVILTVSEADQRLSGRDKVKALSRLARSALMKSCEKSGLHLNSFPKNQKGVPLPVGGVHWSVTHKSDMVGGVASTSPVGMDLETIRPVSDALLAKVASEDEWKLVGGNRQNNFFRFWTAKEAVLKAVGKGMAGLSRCRVAAIADDTYMTLTYDETRWPVAHYWFDDHVAALTARHFSVSWIRY